MNSPERKPNQPTHEEAATDAHRVPVVPDLHKPDDLIAEALEAAKKGIPKDQAGPEEQQRVFNELYNKAKSQQTKHETDWGIFYTRTMNIGGIEVTHVAHHNPRANIMTAKDPRGGTEVKQIGAMPWLYRDPETDQTALHIAVTDKSLEGKNIRALPAGETPVEKGGRPKSVAYITLPGKDSPHAQLHMHTEPVQSDGAEVAIRENKAVDLEKQREDDEAELESRERTVLKRIRTTAAIPPDYWKPLRQGPLSLYARYISWATKAVPDTPFPLPTMAEVLQTGVRQDYLQVRSELAYIRDHTIGAFIDRKLGDLRFTDRPVGGKGLRKGPKEGWATDRDLESLKLIVNIHPGARSRQNRFILGETPEGKPVALPPYICNIIYGGVGSGKTKALEYAMLHENGHILNISAKPDMLKDTIGQVSQTHRVYVLDLMDEMKGVGNPLSPIKSCDSRQAALVAATGFAEAASFERGGKDNMDFWMGKAKELLAPIFHATYLRGGNMQDAISTLDTLNPPAKMESPTRKMLYDTFEKHRKEQAAEQQRLERLIDRQKKNVNRLERTERTHVSEKLADLRDKVIEAQDRRAPAYEILALQRDIDSAVKKMTTLPMQERDIQEEILKDLGSERKRTIQEQKDARASNDALTALCDLAPETSSSVVGVAKESLFAYTFPTVSNTCDTEGNPNEEINLREIFAPDAPPAALYIVGNPKKQKMLQPISDYVISEAMEGATTAYNATGESTGDSVALFADELAFITLSDFPKIAAIGRGVRLRINGAIQSRTDAVKKYGEDGVATIEQNSGITVFGNPTDDVLPMLNAKIGNRYKWAQKQKNPWRYTTPLNPTNVTTRDQRTHRRGAAAGNKRRDKEEIKPVEQKDFQRLKPGEAIAQYKGRTFYLRVPLYEKVVTQLHKSQERAGKRILKRQGETGKGILSTRAQEIWNRASNAMQRSSTIHAEAEVGTPIEKPAPEVLEDTKTPPPAIEASSVPEADVLNHGTQEPQPERVQKINPESHKKEPPHGAAL